MSKICIQKWDDHYRTPWVQNTGVQRQCLKLQFDGRHKDGTSWAIANLKPSFDIHSLHINSDGLAGVKLDIGCVGHCKDPCTRKPEQMNLTGVCEGLDVSAKGCSTIDCKSLNCMGDASCAPDCCDNECDPCDPDKCPEPEEGVKPEPYDLVVTIHGEPEIGKSVELCFEYTMK